ncbi:hypothetical protein QUF72_12860 [Desulfobacterales bacterium HSG2]|nr:hypothetical protein [Desulfobacterales bacterium HSG2]
MSTLVTVRKNGIVCIAAETVTTFGRERLRAPYTANPEKICRVGDSYIGFVGSAAHEMVLESIFSKEADIPEFRNRMEIFEFFRKLHPRLKEEYFLNPKDEDDDPYESTRICIFIANAYGIFSIFELREVYEYIKYWAIGSGSSYALGAMHAIYDHTDSAEEIAKAGVGAGIEFDGASSGPITSYCVSLASS